MPYNQAVNVMGFAYHYFTIKPGLFEAQGFVLWMKRGCRTNHLVRQPLLDMLGMDNALVDSYFVIG